MNEIPDYVIDEELEKDRIWGLRNLIEAYGVACRDSQRAWTAHLAHIAEGHSMKDCPPLAEADREAGKLWVKLMATIDPDGMTS